MKGNEYNPTEVVATLINQQDTLVDGIRSAQEKVQGSCSLLLLTDDAHLRRPRSPRPDPRRHRPQGRRLRRDARDLRPAQPRATSRSATWGPARSCASRPRASRRSRRPASTCRSARSCGSTTAIRPRATRGSTWRRRATAAAQALARADDVEVDCVAGIPDSGIGHAIGYAAEAGVPYRRPFVKYTPTWPRSFMPQDQRVRDLVAQMKLIPDPRAHRTASGSSSARTPSSAARSSRTSSGGSSSCGAREVHMRPACPPLVYGCRFLNFSRSQSELDLAARRAIKELEGDAVAAPRRVRRRRRRSGTRAMVERIRQRLGLTTLCYQTLPDMVAGHRPAAREALHLLLERRVAARARVGTAGLTPRPAQVAVPRAGCVPPALGPKRGCHRVAACRGPVPRPRPSAR